MGQHFKFLNLVSNVISTAPVARNNDLPWEKNLHYGTDEEIREDFDEACLKNEWRRCDVVAVGEYDDVVYVFDDRVIRTNIAYLAELREVIKVVPPPANTTDLTGLKEIIEALPNLRSVYPSCNDSQSEITQA